MRPWVRFVWSFLRIMRPPKLSYLLPEGRLTFRILHYPRAFFFLLFQGMKYWRSTSLWDAFCLTEIKSYRSFSTVKSSWLAKLHCKEQKENMWSRWRCGVPQSSVCCCDGYLSHWASVPVAVLAFWKGKSLCSSFVTECWTCCLFLFLEEMPFCSEAANCRGVLLCEASI